MDEDDKDILEGSPQDLTCEHLSYVCSAIAIGLICTYIYTSKVHVLRYEQSYKQMYYFPNIEHLTLQFYLYLFAYICTGSYHRDSGLIANHESVIVVTVSVQHDAWLKSSRTTVHSCSCSTPRHILVILSKINSRSSDPG